MKYRGLLIIGAGVYSSVAYEVASEMECFDKIGYIDDKAEVAFDGTPVLGTFDDLQELHADYDSVFVAIGNPVVRKSIVEKLRKNTGYILVTLVSPRSHLSPSADIGEGCIVEAMAVVNSRAVIGTAVLLCAGSVVNHAAVVYPYSQIDCNATVAGGATVPEGTKVESNTVFR